jgi:hypothetical protein
MVESHKIYCLDKSQYKPDEWKNDLMRTYLLCMGEYNCSEAAVGSKGNPEDFISMRENASEENRKMTKRRKMANIELYKIGGLSMIG